MIVALTITIACFSGVAVADGTEESDPDALIEAALRNFDVDCDYCFTRKKLYGTDSEACGYVYDFRYGKTCGYAVVVKDGDYSVREFFFDAVNPYADVELPVYAGLYKYLKKEGNFYFDVLTSETVLRPSRFRLRLQRHR